MPSDNVERERVRCTVAWSGPPEAARVGDADPGEGR